MGIMLDIAIVLFVLISTYLGYKKGLISLGIHLVAFIAALLITFVLYRPIGNLIINTTNFDENLQQTIQTNIEKFTENNEGKEETNILVESCKRRNVTTSIKRASNKHHIWNNNDMPYMWLQE